MSVLDVPGYGIQDDRLLHGAERSADGGKRSIGGKRPEMDVSEMLRVHMQAVRRVEELQQEGEQLKKAGKIREAQRVLKHAQELQGQIEAVERELKQQK